MHVGRVGIVLLLAAHATSATALGEADLLPAETSIDLAQMPLLRCDELPPSEPSALVSLACPAAIRPGANSNACTLNFVVTDGTDLYIGAAGHCSFVGKRLSVAGVPGEVGTAIHVRNLLLNGDWAFYRIDPEDRVYVDPTMCRFGGPIEGPLGASRFALPGDIALHYGHGVALGSIDETKGRVGAPVVPLPLVSKSFAFAGSVAGGDSGSPVRAATGEAIGIVIATIVPGYAPNLVIATAFTEALAGLEIALGRDVWVVAGDTLPEWLDDAVPPLV